MEKIATALVYFLAGYHMHYTDQNLINFAHLYGAMFAIRKIILHATYRNEKFRATAFFGPEWDGLIRATLVTLPAKIVGVVKK
jgi:hypothetical protein